MLHAATKKPEFEPQPKISTQPDTVLNIVIVINASTSIKNSLDYQVFKNTFCVRKFATYVRKWVSSVHSIYD